MPEKTEAELREVAALLEQPDSSYDDFPDGCTWADVDAARKLDEEGADARNDD
jgi:hypothetical protein